MENVAFWSWSYLSEQQTSFSLLKQLLLLKRTFSRARRPLFSELENAALLPSSFHNVF